MAGLLAAALLAVNAFHVHLGHQVRGYTLGILLAVLTSQMLLRALRLASARVWLAHAGLALAFCYTHTLALCTVTAQAYFAEDGANLPERPTTNLRSMPGCAQTGPVQPRLFFTP